MSSKKLELEIVALSHSVTQAHSYAVVLGEVNGVRKLPIVIGGFEAQAIAVALENMQPTRPLTHDLMKNMMLATQLQLVEVLIHKINEGIFYAKLICQTGNETIEIDSRTSDALALAVRFDTPIYTYESILDSAGLQMDETTPKKAAKETDKKAKVKIGTVESDLKKLSLAELQKQLNDVLESEDYIKAAHIRDEINSRK
ncbi:MAG: bifunctional nuclease family protein [Bacteroidetes bacterium]|jgi:bifunctional DNase/RNase|nr:bifunctional nuclease family protein [Bacteroidota bacterium]MBK6820464.1 bifunctional nuclease family protein [Bacteroidota bacterium]MBK7041014.1 bifunctional nuclease family protein [Bacteroidota bacterium]MBK8328901.1 bifunctional nuclease family protein [Bacteroidota bacterium]MBK9302222.1 bifunctional nuclease family protein [Bacteroidota bacterium]